MGARSERIQDYISSVMDSDDEEEKRRVVSEFYERVMRYDLQIESVDRYKTFVARDRRDKSDKFVFEHTHDRWRAEGKAISDADLAEILRVPVSFLCGMLRGVELMQPELMRPFELRQMEIDASRKIEAAKRAVERAKKVLEKAEDTKPTLKSMRRHIEKQIASQATKRTKYAVSKKALAKFNETCRHHNMPQVPSPRMTCRDVTRLKPFRGVYFEWDGLLCSYVGESINVPSRMKSHQKVQPGSLVSFIETKHHKRYEHFYIWLMNPYKNGGLDERF